MSAVLANLADDVLARFRREGQGAVRDATEEGCHHGGYDHRGSASRTRISRPHPSLADPFLQIDKAYANGRLQEWPKA